MLGGNVFGWTAGERESMRVLDAYLAAGGNFVDTADVYSHWVEGHSGGESEEIIGRWLAARGNRDQVVLATKVGSEGGLGAANVRARLEASLRRLRTDHVDLLYMHADDEVTPPDETLGALDELVSEGAIRYAAASNHSPRRLAGALATARRLGLPRYVALQANYSLVERSGYEDALRDVCAEEGVACIPYFSLGRGFLTGKYRPGEAAADTRRAREELDGAEYLGDPRAVALLGVLEEIAAARGAPMASVALAWLLAQPTVAAVAASARTPAQLDALLPAIELELAPDELERLDAASHPQA